ncbi:hypothetical protein ACOSQ2_024858 [Xanthoceras sorbifolium]
MSEFVCMDWDLQAIVRGYNSTEEMISTSVMENPTPSCFAPLSLQQDGFSGFPDICETTTILNELEEFYKPFYPQTILTSSISVPSSTEVVKKPNKVVQKAHQHPLSGSTSGDSTDTDPEIKPRKSKKNQHKRVVVQQVTIDGLSADVWAWRKYGQKPIKGSPYPRSYYRCSSSKGCLARKQVERSRSDPGIFVITYSAEHNHAHPTRRSSLAGSTRSKSLMQRGPDTSTDQPLHEQTELAVVSTTTTPDNNLVTSIKEEEFTLQEDMKKLEERVQILFEDIEEENGIVMPDILFSDDLFPSLEDFDGLLLDQFPSNFDVRA